MTQTRFLKYSKMALAIVALAAALPAWPQAPGNVKSITTTLNSGGARRECLGLATQQRLHYWYRADGALNFAVQYVAGRDTLYPVKKDNAAIGTGSYQPKVATDYCLVWTNVAKRPVTLSYEFARLGGG